MNAIPEIDLSYENTDTSRCWVIIYAYYISVYSVICMCFVILCYCVFMQDAGSIVSVVCGTNRIAWSHVDREMVVLDWQQVDCPNFLRGTYMASAYLSDVSIRLFQWAAESTWFCDCCWADLLFYTQVSAVVSLLPSTDFYVIEKPSISVQNTALFPVMAHMRTVEAMLFALLEPRNTPNDSNIPPK